MAEYFPTSFTTVQPGPGTIVLADADLFVPVGATYEVVIASTGTATFTLDSWFELY